MRSFLLSSAAATLLVASQPLFAQTAPGSPGSSVGRRPVATPAGTANQQGAAANSSFWFSDPVVRRELGMSAEQYDRLSRAYGQTQSQYNASLSALDQNRSLTAAERQAQTEQLRSTYYNNVNTEVLNHLTTPEQQARYNQLVMQYMGYGAFNHVPVREQLRLNDEQMLRVNEYGRNWDTQLNRFRSDYATDPQGASRRFAAARTEALRNLGGVLTPEQQQQYQQLTGTNVDFGASAYFDPTVDIFGNSVVQNGVNANGTNVNADGTAVNPNATNGTNVNPNAANVNAGNGTNNPNAANVNAGNGTNNPNAGNVNAGNGTSPNPDGTITPGLDPNSPVRPGTNFGDVQPGRNPRGDVQPGRNPTGDVLPGRNPTGDVQPGRNPTGGVQPGRNPAGGVQPGRNPAGGAQPGRNTAGQIQTGANPGALIQPGANPLIGSGAKTGTPNGLNTFPFLPTQPGINPNSTGVKPGPGVNPRGPIQPAVNPTGGAVPAGGAAPVGGAAPAGGGAGGAAGAGGAGGGK